jgi:hydrogenase expression/formation protein HypE
MKNKPIQIKAVLFRLEGTLTAQNECMLDRFKHSIGCPTDHTLVEFITSLPKSKRRNQILLDLDGLELQNAPNLIPDISVSQVIRYLRSKELRLGIISDKSLKVVRGILHSLKTIRPADVGVIISLDHFLKNKPETNVARAAAEKMKLPVKNVLMVSTRASDIHAAKKAGAIGVFWIKEHHADLPGFDSDYEIKDIKDLKHIVRMGIPLPAGKLPNELLRDFLNQFIFNDPSILINPAVGEDIAAVDVQSQEVLVLKSDPITFATESIGRYAVLVNANDIATSGATPRWLLITLFFPCGTTASQIRHVFEELEEFCQRWGITLCGGHTEITDAVARPIVAGMMAGTVAKKELIDKRNMAKGDQILLSKALAVEGTAIIAREFGDRLKRLGMPANKIHACRHFLENISVMPEAKIAATNPGTSAMHDVTEGGLATALEELSIAGGHKIRIYADKIPIFAETQKICELLDIDPLGLIGSGSLLICCRRRNYKKLMTEIRNADIQVAIIGEVNEKGQGVSAFRGHKQVGWPAFEVDEITKLF